MEQNITQESLAQQLGVTNQAVSKWKSEQCCPDVILLPRLADLFHISMDELFERVPTVPVCPGRRATPFTPSFTGATPC